MSGRPVIVGGAPCSWGIIENFRSETDGGAAQMLMKDAVDAGFTALDFGDWDFFPTDPTAAKAFFDKNGMMLMGAFQQVRFCDKLTADHPDILRLRELASVLKKFNGQPEGLRPFVVLADQMDNEERLQNAGRIWKLEQFQFTSQKQAIKDQFVESFHFVLKVLKEEGVDGQFHPHAGSRIETIGEIDWLLEKVPGLEIIYDSGHLLYCNPQCSLVDLIHRWFSSIGSVHFKDISVDVIAKADALNLNWAGAIEHGVVPAIGGGDIDFKAIMDAFLDRGYKRFICLEQDVFGELKPGEVMRSQKQQRKYVELLAASHSLRSRL